MTAKEYHLQQIQEYSQKQRKLKFLRNGVTLGKLFCFGMLAFLLYMFTTGSPSLLLPWAIVSAISFIFLTVADYRIVQKQKITEEFIRLSTVELEYLEHNFSHLPTGEEFQDSSHPYANDLDIFGSDSLFQHINRTVTARGNKKLISWLLSPARDRQEIAERQEATGELLRQTGWCHQFRVEGKIHPTSITDAHMISVWNQQPHFCKKKSILSLLYIANIITLSGWAAVICNLIPFPVAAFFSLLQLFTVGICLKKINSYHRNLGHITSTLSHYLPLIRLMHKQDFSSVRLRKLKHILFSEEANSLQAMIKLDGIQNNLDQRANILLFFILNGLYLRDLHTIIALDKWKKKYGSYIDQWIESVSETDTLISMANYRFNHPAYCLPEINAETFLVTTGAGHPLLKSAQSVTNDFKIDRQHQLFIITGANMAGKSTFLRTIGINLVLALSGNVVCASTFTLKPMAIFTSMRTTDNLSKGTSYFHAELLRLRQLTEMAAKEENLFIILDEILKGTNSVDKLNGSKAFLKKLLSYPVSGLIATHDLALGELATELPGHFSNFCFEITHSGNNISYDYKLYPGISNTMNATILLRQMGLI